MLNQLDTLAKRIGGSNVLVDAWLNARRPLLVAWYQMVGIKPNNDSAARPDEKILDNFCQSLVDYLSVGHFSVYQRIISEMQGDSPMIAAAQIYPALEDNTQQLMALYDEHLVQAIDTDSGEALQQALSETGELLETRFTLEDKLIQLAWDNNLTPPAAANDLEVQRPA